MLRRIPTVVLALTLLLLSTIFLPTIQAFALTATLPPRTVTPTITRTRTPACTSAPTYSVSIWVSAATVKVGDQITVSASSNVGLARYSLYINDLATGTTQSATDPIFTPTTNATLSAPAQWTLTAVRAGSVSFRVAANGEIQTCTGGNLAWVFSVVNGVSGAVTVNTGSTSTLTPTPTITRTPTPACVAPTYYVTVSPSATTVNAGDQITVSAYSNVGIADYSLYVIDTATGAAQSLTNPIFNPTTFATMRAPAKWTLTAARAGSVTFRVSVYGEIAICSNGFLTLTFGGASGTSGVVSVNAGSSTLTPTPTVTRTPTITPTLVGPAICQPVTSVITAPFSFDGAGTYCWQSTNLGSYMNSWNLTSLLVNGVTYTNQYLPVASYPAKISGYWNVQYAGSYPWSHFEAK